MEVLLAGHKNAIAGELLGMKKISVKPGASVQRTDATRRLAEGREPAALASIRVTHGYYAVYTYRHKLCMCYTLYAALAVHTCHT